MNTTSRTHRVRAFLRYVWDDGVRAQEVLLRPPSHTVESVLADQRSSWAPARLRHGR